MSRGELRRFLKVQVDYNFDHAVELEEACVFAVLEPNYLGFDEESVDDVQSM